MGVVDDTVDGRVDDMSSVEIDKTLLAFLNGLCRRQYFGEGQFTDEFLKEEVLGELDDAGFANILKKFQSIMVTLVSADMDYSQLDAFLTSQMKKRQAPLSDVEAATIRRFWKNQKHKIHNELVKKSTNDSHVKALSWRVDVQNKGRFIDEINRGTAIVELKLGAATTDEVSEVVRFELNSQKLSSLLQQVDDIQLAIDSNMQA